MKCSKVLNKIAFKMRDIRTPYVLKRDMIRPVMMGLREAVIEAGEVTIVGFGTFYVCKRKVTKRPGSHEKKLVMRVAFKPSPIFLEEVEKKWTAPVSISLVEPSSQEPASSAPSAESSGSSAEEPPAAADTSTT